MSSAVFTQCSNSTAELLRLHSHLLRWTTPEMDSISFLKYTPRAEHTAARFKRSISVLSVGLGDSLKNYISVLLAILCMIPVYIPIFMYLSEIVLLVIFVLLLFTKEKKKI